MQRSGTHAPRRGFLRTVAAMTAVILGAAILAIVATATRPAHAGVALVLVVLLGARLEHGAES